MRSGRFKALLPSEHGGEGLLRRRDDLGTICGRTEGVQMIPEFGNMFFQAWAIQIQEARSVVRIITEVVLHHAREDRSARRDREAPMTQDIHAQRILILDFGAQYPSTRL